MKRSSIRIFAILIVFSLIAQQVWAPPARPAGKGGGTRGGSRGPGRGSSGIGRHPVEKRIPFQDILVKKVPIGYGVEKPTAEAEALQKLLYQKEELKLEDLLLLGQMTWDLKLSFEERSIIERELDKLKPRETEAEKLAREFHNTHFPAQEVVLSGSILAIPDSLREVLSSDVEHMREIRTQIYAFHRGVDRLRRSGWDAQRALAEASEAAAKTTNTAEATRSSGPPSRLPSGLRKWRKAPLPPLPPEIKKLLPLEAGAEWQRYAYRILSGQDSALSLAYMDFLYACALSGASEFLTLAKLEVTRKPASSNPETAMLRELTHALINDAHIRTAKSVLQHLPDLTRHINSPPVHRLAAALPTDTVQVAVARAGKEVVALEKIPEWQRSAKLRNSSEGFTATEKVIDLYLRDGESMHLVRVDRKSAQTFLLLGENANVAFRDHCQTQIRKYSRPGFRLANVLRVKGGYRVLMADRSIRLTNAEAAQLDRGERLPPEHALSRAIARDPGFVVYSHPLMAREGRYRSDADRLAFSIQRSYSEARVFKDDFSDSTESRARAVNDFVIDSASAIIVLKAADSLKVDDANIINDIVDELAKSGIAVKEISENSASISTTDGHSRLVIAISGHIDESLAAFVRRAGEAGHFRNNIVVFNSCASELTSQLAHEINTRYGAIATYRYEGKIPAVKVQEILLKLNDNIDQKPRMDDWKHFVLEEGLTGVWNICMLVQQEGNIG